MSSLECIFLHGGVKIHFRKMHLMQLDDFDFPSRSPATTAVATGILRMADMENSHPIRYPIFLD